MTKLVVSLTTIPSRLPSLARTLQSLHRQDTVPDVIELNLPRSYSKRSLGRIDPDLIPGGCTVRWVPQDMGPATKVLPTVRRYRAMDAWIVYCDDDQSYDPQWLTRLTRTARKHPDRVIADRCRSSLKWENRAHWKDRALTYKLWRLASLGLWKPVRPDGYVWDVAEGMGGVLIRPEFVDDAAFDIPETLWCVDDVWLSGIYLKNGHAIQPTGVDWRALEKRSATSAEAPRARDPLYDCTVDGLTRMQANLACIRHMRDRFGVFSGQRSTRWQDRLFSSI